MEHVSLVLTQIPDPISWLSKRVRAKAASSRHTFTLKVWLAKWVYTLWRYMFLKGIFRCCVFVNECTEIRIIILQNFYFRALKKKTLTQIEFLLPVNNLINVFIYFLSVRFVYLSLSGGHALVFSYFSFPPPERLLVCLIKFHQEQDWLQLSNTDVTI